MRPDEGNDDQGSQDREGDPTGIARPALRGLLAGWLAAKTVPWLIRLTVWGSRLALAGSYAAFVWWRTRRAILTGALDDRIDPRSGSPPSAIARERGILAWIRGPGADG